MSTSELIEEIKTLSEQELQDFFSKLLSDSKLKEELERIGYLKLTENSFGFWNDPREDIYQDYLQKK